MLESHVGVLYDDLAVALAKWGGELQQTKCSGGWHKGPSHQCSEYQMEEWCYPMELWGATQKATKTQIK